MSIKIPNSVTIDEARVTNFTVNKTFETLRQELKVKEFLVAHLIGTNKETTNSEENGISIWEFDPKQPKENTYAIVLGMEEKENIQYVHVVKSKDDTPEESTIRTHKPLDKKVYAIAFEEFQKRFWDVFSPLLSLEFVNGEEDYFNKMKENLNSSKPEDIKNLGQEVFNHYKEENFSNSNAGLEVLQKIYSKFEGNDKETINEYWQGVGDNHCMWS